MLLRIYLPVRSNYLWEALVWIGTFSEKRRTKFFKGGYICRTYRLINRVVDGICGTKVACI